jgi:hypothetical protein
MRSAPRLKSKKLVFGGRWCCPNILCGEPNRPHRSLAVQGSQAVSPKPLMIRVCPPPWTPLEKWSIKYQLNITDFSIYITLFNDRCWTVVLQCVSARPDALKGWKSVISASSTETVHTKWNHVFWRTNRIKITYIMSPWRPDSVPQTPMPCSRVSRVDKCRNRPPKFGVLGRTSSRVIAPSLASCCSL